MDLWQVSSEIIDALASRMSHELNAKPQAAVYGRKQAIINSRDCRGHTNDEVLRFYM
jgi:hypothetical protein